ncbi:MAG: ABC transporter ATP-binding protein [Actinomycetota bacterium]|nr:ABC transporter ATP-binding protein [Actinomycetota bacterium]
MAKATMPVMSDPITLEVVSKRLGEREVLKSVSFAVKTGDVFGYLGPNGAGKTTTIRILLGLLELTSGKANILGEDVSRDEARRKVGFALEQDGLYENKTAWENLSYYAWIYEVAESAERIDKVLDLVGLQDRANDRVGTYSKGMKQRLALARAMIHDPELLILDEPTSGVDPSGQREVREVILNMAHGEGKTIFLSSHNLDEVQRICNRIALIDRGEIKLCGELEQLQQEMSNREVVIETAEITSEPLFAELKSIPRLGLQEGRGRSLIFVPQEGVKVPEIVSFLVGRGVGIEGVSRKKASLEEIYATILEKAELS